MKTTPKTWFFILVTIVLGACGSGMPTGAPETGVIESAVRDPPELTFDHEQWCSDLWNAYFFAQTDPDRKALLDQIVADDCLRCSYLTDAWYQIRPEDSTGEVPSLIEALGPYCKGDPLGQGCCMFRCR